VLKRDIYDSTALQAVQTLAAGLHSYLTNPTSRWFALAMKDKELMSDFLVKGWLKVCENIIFDSLNSSNFNQQIHETYIEFAVAGTAPLYLEEDPIDSINFQARPIKECFILANSRGRIDTVYRLFKYTARQAYQKWGNNAGTKTMDLLNAGKVEEFMSFLHIILPREERDVRKKDARNMPFSSIYIEPKTRKILSEGGYEEFPFFIPRFYKISESEYAYSPAAVAKADIQMINAMSETNIKGAQKDVAPWMVLPHDGYLLPFKTTPDAINYRISGDPTEKVEIPQIRRNFNISLELENQRRQSIEKAFFVDLFLMLNRIRLSGEQKTATEVIEMVNERMLILGPVLGRLMHELLGPIIVRTFAILARLGKLPPPPQRLIDEGRQYKIEYISPLAKAQRASEARSISELMMAVKAVGEINPIAFDNINIDETVKEYADVLNTPANILHSDDERKEIREQRAQAEQMQREVELLSKAAPAAKDAVEAEAVLTGKGGKK
jgi:hypothetical protein